uniref:HTH CENPB-type domain-containing protein n=1 Tax=Ditylenchus dipsaci TaxID=166011 RepID=A0A915EUU4_9BILA
MVSNENSDQAARMDAMQEANENWDRQAAINAEDEERLNKHTRGSKRMKLNGGGRKVAYPERDVQLAQWIRETRENKQPVSRRIISTKAAELFQKLESDLEKAQIDLKARKELLHQIFDELSSLAPLRNNSSNQSRKVMITTAINALQIKKMLFPVCGLALPPIRIQPTKPD